MADTDQAWWERYHKLIVWIVVTLVMTLAGAIGGWKFTPVPPPIQVLVEKPVLVEEDPTGRDGRAFGWIEDDEQIAVNLDPVKTPQFRQTPAGKAALGEDDVFLYRAVRKVAGKPAPWYPNINQGSVGCCVGAGSKHGCDVVLATAIASGEQFQWKPISAEVIYAGSRIDVGRGQIRGDGSLGVWAWEYLKNVGGIVPMERIDEYDLSTFSPARARQWGAAGIPEAVKAVAKNHPVKGAALVTSAVDVKRAIGQMYPVVVCSNVGFNNADGSIGTRDRDGFVRARGTWPHCMCFIGWRNGPRPGALCLNSWGDRAHGGPVWPDDMPPAAFWVDEATVDRMVRQGDSFALSDVKGFPVRNPLPDWFIDHKVAEPSEVAVRRRPMPFEALAPLPILAP